MNLKQLFLPRYVCALLNLVLCSLAPTYAAQNEQNKNQLKQKQVKELESLFDQIENEENPKVKFDVKDWDCIITTKKLFSRLISSKEFFDLPYYVYSNYWNKWRCSRTKIEAVIKNRTILSYLLRGDKDNAVKIIQNNSNIRKNLIEEGLKKASTSIWFKDTYQQKSFFFILITTLLDHAPLQLQELLIKELLETFIHTLQKPFYYENEKLNSLQDILEENNLQTFKYINILKYLNGLYIPEKIYLNYDFERMLKKYKNPYRLNIEALLNFELAYRNLRIIEKFGASADAKSIKIMIDVNKQMRQIEKCIEKIDWLLEKSYEVFYQPNNNNEDSDNEEKLKNKVENLSIQAKKKKLKDHANLSDIIPEYITHLCNLYRSIHEKSLKEVLAQIGNTFIFNNQEFSNLNNNSYLNLLNANWGVQLINNEKLKGLKETLIAGTQTAKELQKIKDWEKWCDKYDEIKKEKNKQQISEVINPYENDNDQYLNIRHFVRSKAVVSKKVATYWFRQGKIQTDVAVFINIISGYIIKSPIDELYSSGSRDKGSKKIDQMKYCDLLLESKFARNIAMGHKAPKKMNDYLINQEYYKKEKYDEIKFQVAEAWVATSPSKSSEVFEANIKDLRNKIEFKELIRRMVISTVNEEDAEIQWAKIEYLKQSLKDESIEDLMINLYVEDKYYREPYLAKIKEIPTYKKKFNQAWQSRVAKYINNKYSYEEFGFPTIKFSWVSNYREKIILVRDHLLVYYTLNHKNTFMELIKSYFNFDEQNKSYQELLLGSKDEYFYHLRSFFLPIPKYGLLDNDITSFVEAIDKYLDSKEKKQVDRYFLANYQREFTMKDRKKLAELGGIEGYIPTPNSLLDYLALFKKNAKARSKIYRYLVFFNEEPANEKLIGSEEIWELIKEHHDFYQKYEDKDKVLEKFLNNLLKKNSDEYRKEVGEYLLKFRHVPKKNLENVLYFGFYQTFGKFFKIRDFLKLKFLNRFSNKKKIKRKYISLNNYGDILFPAIGKSQFKKATKATYHKLPKSYTPNPKNDSGYYNDTFFDNPEPKRPNPKSNPMPKPKQENKKMEEEQTDLHTLQSTTDPSDEENPSFSFVRLLINHRLTITVLLVGLAILTGKKVSELIQQKSANKKEEKNENKDEKQTTNQRKMVKSLKRFRSKKLRS